jgi:hypothetical protein
VGNASAGAPRLITDVGDTVGDKRDASESLPRPHRHRDRHGTRLAHQAAAKAGKWWSGWK